ncbi:MAG: metallophosphoesterase [Eubacteriaceae bacterium]|jgi:predicted phosphohydrolase|nr:metallophosphoesterase [Eubacteriaceae bacterium]
MSIFAIGDLHLSLGPNVDKPMDIFGGGWLNHADRLKEEWNDMVDETDTVIVPGDISWALKLEGAMPDLDYVDSLKGHKVIIKGNHDLWWAGITKLNMLKESITFLQNTCYPVPGTGICICGTRGWISPGTEGFDAQDNKIYNRETMRLEKSIQAAAASGADDIIGVMHYPPTNDKKQSSAFTRIFEEYGAKTVVYGHLHGKESFRYGIQGVLNGVEYKLVSLDYLECRPVKLR